MDDEQRRTARTPDFELALNGAAAKVRRLLERESRENARLEALAIFMAGLNVPEAVDRTLDFIGTEWALTYNEMLRLKALATGRAGLPKYPPVAIGQGSCTHDGNGRLIDLDA